MSNQELEKELKELKDHIERFLEKFGGSVLQKDTTTEFTFDKDGNFLSEKKVEK